MGNIIIKNLINSNVQLNEAYETLRSNILYYGSDMKIIGFTSCNHDVEKRIVSLNLAISMAKVGNKVVLVDADMRKLVTTKLFLLNKIEIGLRDYIEATHSLDEITYQSDIENLNLIFSGSIPENPSELLSTDKFRELIQALAMIYDYVLVDTPSIEVAIDGAMVAKVCDSMILIVKPNTVHYKLARKVMKILERTGCPVLGAVIFQGA